MQMEENLQGEFIESHIFGEIIIHSKQITFMQDQKILREHVGPKLTLFINRLFR